MMKKQLVMIMMMVGLFVLVACTNETVPSVDAYAISVFDMTDEIPDESLQLEDIINLVTFERMNANVTVKTYQYLWFKTFGTLYFGSGVIFFYQNPYYYVLTNEHVIELDPDYTAQTFEIEDYKNNVYDAFVYEGSRSLEHDLAVLVFEGAEGLFDPVTIRTINPEMDEPVLSIGSPLGQKNAVLFGEVSGYEQIRVDLYESGDATLDFDSLVHTAKVSEGSSGGMLLDMNLNLIGLNYARSLDPDENIGYAIPAEVIVNYLETYVFWSES